MMVKTIAFPPGGYASGRTVYAFVFNDRSVYIGITGTSNRTGESRPLERLASHLRKCGKTFSILHKKDLNGLRNKGFKFCYAILPAKLSSRAAEIESSCCLALREKKLHVRNTTSKSSDTIGNEVGGIARQFADAVQKIIAGE